jgi:hypothetical protein
MVGDSRDLSALGEAFQQDRSLEIGSMIYGEQDILIENSLRVTYSFL